MDEIVGFAKAIVYWSPIWIQALIVVLVVIAMASGDPSHGRNIPRDEWERREQQDSEE